MAVGRHRRRPQGWDRSRRRPVAERSRSAARTSSRACAASGACSPSPLGKTVAPQSEWRWVVIAVGRWGGTEVGGLGFSTFRWPRLVVLPTFGGDAHGAVLGAGARAFGHHRGALTAVVLGQACFRGGRGTGAAAQTGE